MRPVNLTGKANVWPVKSPVRPDIVHWPAVISSPDCFIIQHIDCYNKAPFYCRKAGDDLHFASFLYEIQNHVHRRISVDYGWWIFNTPWPYLGSVTMCWIIIPYLFAYKLIPAISRDPKLERTDDGLKLVKKNWQTLGYKPRPKFRGKISPLKRPSQETYVDCWMNKHNQTNIQKFIVNS